MAENILFFTELFYYRVNLSINRVDSFHYSQPVSVVTASLSSSFSLAATAAVATLQAAVAAVGAAAAARLLTIMALCTSCFHE